MAMIGFFLTFTLLLQIGLGFSAVHAALTGIPTAVGIGATMALAGERLVPKLGRYALIVGSSIMAAGLIGTLWVTHHYMYDLHSWQLIPSLLCTGIGMAFVFGSLFAAVLNGVDAKHAGSASGVLNATQQVGGAIGVAVIGVIFFGQLSAAAPDSFARVEPELRQTLSRQHLPAQAEDTMVATVRNCYVDRSREKDASVVPASCALSPTPTDNEVSAAAMPTGFTIDMRDIVKIGQKANAANFSHAFRWAIIYAIGLLVVTSSLAFALPKRFKAEAYTEAI